MWQRELASPRHRNQLIVNGAVLGLFLVFGGCSPEYQAGDCIQNPKDGYIWRITTVEFGKYTAQGWVNGKWGPYRFHGYGPSEAAVRQNSMPVQHRRSAGAQVSGRCGITTRF